ncbi:hypothetical protein Q8A67_018706 [Cirrhinus molitorella]|uniref:Uncharacterized protein n=1 Tax=Cirrhinus molitorella TaxID=172907 RepID=A0AA88PEY4_9TELE|nr:hypothetical protein Q8A67_018706 [Cirrhinus molitorella]
MQNKTLSGKEVQVEHKHLSDKLDPALHEVPYHLSRNLQIQALTLWTLLVRVCATHQLQEVAGLQVGHVPMQGTEEAGDHGGKSYFPLSHLRAAQLHSQKISLLMGSHLARTTLYHSSSARKLLHCCALVLLSLLSCPLVVLALITRHSAVLWFTCIGSAYQSGADDVPPPPIVNSTASDLPAQPTVKNSICIIPRLVSLTSPEDHLPGPPGYLHLPSN